MKRFLCIFLSVLMICFCTSCKGGDGGLFSKDEEKKKSTGLEIPYSREDGMNPFTATSLMNEKLMPLLYSGLFKIDVNYNPENDIASDITFEGKRAIVKLKSSRSFSNGRGITADDVVYSFKRAKESPFYSTALQNINSCHATSTYEVEFSLPYKNIYVASVLTFPIVESQSANSSDDIPASSGPYKYEVAAEGGKLTPSNVYSTSYELDEISLINISDSETLHFNRVVGNLDAIFDDFASGDSTRITGSSAKVDLNNLVYIGINQNVTVFKSAEVRKNLFCALDRAALLNSGFEGYGAVTDLPFNFNWYVAKDLKGNMIPRDQAKSYMDSHIDKYVVNILVNSDNNFKRKMADELSNQLRIMGISTKIVAVKYGVYKNAVEAGRYDLYIGEYKLTNDMNIVDVLGDDAVVESYRSMIAGDIKPEDFMKVYNEAQPIIPVCMRYGVLAYSEAMEGSVKPLPNNPYASITEWFI